MRRLKPYMMNASATFYDAAATTEASTSAAQQSLGTLIVVDVPGRLTFTVSSEVFQGARDTEIRQATFVCNTEDIAGEIIQHPSVVVINGAQYELTGTARDMAGMGTMSRFELYTSQAGTLEAAS